MIDREQYDPSFDMEEFVSVPARHTVIARRADSDFEALQIAQAMEDVGASVISVSFDGTHQPYGTLAPLSKFLVWAKLNQHLSVDQVDQAISKKLGFTVSGAD